MSICHLYDDFGSVDTQGPGSALTNADSMEEVTLQAFEEGYKAGWDDAVKAHVNDRDRISAEFAQNLQDLSFTFHEAYSKLSIAMKPLMNQMVSKLLPSVAQKTLMTEVMQQLTDMMEEGAKNVIELAVSPDNLETIAEMLDAEVSSPFKIAAEPALSPGQVYLRVNTAEREINFDAVLAGISDGVAAFFQQIEKEKPNG